MPFTNKITINQKSTSGPSGVIYKGSRCIAWRGTDNEVNVMMLQPNGGDGAKITAELTVSDPSLFTDGTNLFVSWTGTDDQLNMAQVPF